MNGMKKLVLWTVLSCMTQLSAQAGKSCGASCGTDSGKGEQTEVKTP